MQKTTRREFIKQSTCTVIGAALLPQTILPEVGAKRLLGVQLYSVRNEMMKDPMGTLQQLAAMGYKNVEHANYSNRKFYGWSAHKFKKILNGLGLYMPSGHTVMKADHWDAEKKDFTDVWKYTVEDAAIMGQKYVISPSLEENLRKNYDELKAFLDVFNKSGELCKKSGMKFGYHNHDFEFSEELNGQKIFDIILQNTDPALVIQQLDIGNMYHAGGIALDIMKQYPGRFQSMHVKDEIKTETDGEMNGKYESTVLGNGVVPVHEIVTLGRKSGVLHFIIEQESYQGKKPIDCVKENLAIMKKWNF